jgi:flagellar hook-associated protein 1 FlgK
MSDLLGIGASALNAYQTALSAVGENVANAQTPGYARRRVVLQEQTVVGSGDIAYRPQVTFNGVTATGVARAWDDFKANEARFATSAAGRSGVREQWLGSVESALDDSASGIGSAMTGFFTAASSLASDPGDPLGRRSVLTALDAAAGAFRNSGQALARISDGVGQAAELEVDAVNDALKALHDVNGALAPAAQGGSARASLEDQRDQLIDFIAGKIDLKVTIGNDGRATLAAAAGGNLILLSGSGPSLVSLVPATDGRLSLQLSTNGTTIPLPAAGGTLAGLVDIAAGVADRRATLDGVATDFAALVNNWSAGGKDADGNAGANLLSATGGAAGMQALAGDPDLVPAATAAAPNGNLLALDAIRTASGIEGRWSALVSANAQALSSAKAENAAASKWQDSSKAALDEVTGVDLDTEAAEMLRFQQAYSAAARIVQVARENIQAIFDAL